MGLTSSSFKKGHLGYWRGKKFTQEHKNSIGLAGMGRKMSPITDETRQKMKISHLGKIPTAETIGMPKRELLLEMFKKINIYQKLDSNY